MKPFEYYSSSPRATYSVLGFWLVDPPFPNIWRMFLVCCFILSYLALPCVVLPFAKPVGTGRHDPLPGLGAPGRRACVPRDALPCRVQETRRDGGRPLYHGRGTYACSGLDLLTLARALEQYGVPGTCFSCFLADRSSCPVRGEKLGVVFGIATYVQYARSVLDRFNQPTDAAFEKGQIVSPLFTSYARAVTDRQFPLAVSSSFFFDCRASLPPISALDFRARCSIRSS